MASNRREMSSSPGLSTPPKSPESPESPSSGEAIVVQSKAVAYADLTKPPAHKSNTVKSARQSTAGTGESATKPPRKPRTAKKKQEEGEEDDDGNAAPKQRKPRKKKDAQHLSASMASAQKPTAAGQGPGNKIQSSKQPRISGLMSAAPPATPPNGPTAQSSVPIGNKSEAIQKSEFTTTASTNHTPLIRPPATAPASRGQNYDPIRSSTIEVPRPMQVSNPATPAQTSPVKTASRASASPSIASLINPPSAPSYPAAKSVSRPSSSSAKLHISPHPNAFVHQPQKSAGSVESPRSVPLIPTPTVKPPTPDRKPLPTAMDVDSDVQTKPLKPATSRKPSVSTNNSSNVPSPKQAGTKSKNSTSTPTLPPLPGTGILSGSGLFNGGPSNEPAISGQTIIIEVPLNGETNKCINFARLAEEKYGYNALYPKLAAQRDRLARIAAAGAALENATKANGTSADEMSLDVSEAEGDQSNADKKGSATEDGKPKKRKRTMKEDQYDKDDPFVDDSELAWEEQAAASKDGFFVYSGPLVAPGQQANVERYVPFFSAHVSNHAYHN